MAEPITHERATFPMRSFTILYATFDRENGKNQHHRIPALPKHASAERQFDLMSTASSVNVSHT
jgi:hypothetical protein